ncbi:MAG: acyl-CoA dehydrogenase family protein, partial [Halioglobus sp.]|nr:acyl-CoA dehydrogenase family protein [Halioglobus sp.]
MRYLAPEDDLKFLLFDVLNAQELQRLDRYTEASGDVLMAILEEMGKFAAEVLQPLNKVGDTQGCTYDPGSRDVRTPQGFREAYRQFCDAGWTRLDAPPEFGGQGLPHVLKSILDEMVCSSNLSWGMYAGLSHGAISALYGHGSPELQATYLEPLVSGRWTGTMCLTEPQCGTDLGLIRSRAEPVGDGTYLIKGTKIWITGGEHDLAENIVHLV